MYNNQPEKQIGTVFTFGEKSNLTASATAIVKAYLPAPGGTSAVTTEFAVVIPHKGTLKNLYWTAEASSLTANGNSITVYVKDPATLPASSPTGLAALWNSNAKSGSNNTPIPVNAGATLSVYVQLAKGTGTLTRLRVSIELEIDAPEPNPWDLSANVLSFSAGKVGIGTSNPTGELHVKNVSGTAGVFESSTKIISGTDGTSEKFSVNGNGDVFASGKIGIGTMPNADLDVNGTIQTKALTLTTGGNNGYVLTSDASGNGTWQPIGGASGSLVGNGSVDRIAKFLGSGELDDSVIFQNGNNIGIGTDTPASTLDVNGAISGFGIVPVGSIIAWHKNLPGTPALPDGWMECNGQTCSDIASMFNGQVIPNLNGDALGANSPDLNSKENMFLRGGTTSGKGQDDAFQGHHHQVENGSAGEYVLGGAFQTTWGLDSFNGRVSTAITDGVNGKPRLANETRPKNMSVVWIMRIK